MNKIALITGATDGIGKETAFALASQKFDIHVLGRNQKRASEVMQQLHAVHPSGKHQFYQCDLSSKAAVQLFLANYLQTQERLDVLILNAGIFNKKKRSIDGIDLAFSVGYISRYLFSVQLQALLEKSSYAKVIHLCGSPIGGIAIDKLATISYSSMRGVWQNAVASALLCLNWNKLYPNSHIQHYHWNPGVVNTQTVKSQGFMVRFLSRLAGMMEPEMAGSLLANFASNPQQAQGKFYTKGKEKKPPTNLLKDSTQWERLLHFSRSFTA